LRKKSADAQARGLAQIRSLNNFQYLTTTLDQTMIEVPYAPVRPDLSEGVFILFDCD
jgi:hypothetical protein